MFEILSPGNRLSEMAKKFQFYEKYGVEEYYLYDPAKQDLTVCLRQGQKLEVIDEIAGWVSPRLGVKFDLTESGIELIRPDGQKFLTSQELAQRAEAESQRAHQAEERVKLLEARLRELNINPEDL